MQDGVEIRPLVEGGGTALVLYRMEGGVQYPMHQHPHPEYGTVILGRCRFLLQDGPRELTEGDSYFVPANAPHGVDLPPQPNPVVLLHVVVSPANPPDRTVIDQMIREARDVLRPAVGSCPEGDAQTGRSPRVRPRA